MRESTIETYLRKKVKAAGGLCWKFVSPNLRGVPDRVVVTPLGNVYWVELKAPGQTPRGDQLRRHEELRERNQTVLVIDSKEGVDFFVAGCL